MSKRGTIRDGAFYKRQKLSEISKEIAKRLSAGEKILYQKFLFWIQYEKGLTPRKSKEYLELILNTHDSWKHNGAFIILEEEPKAP